MKSLYARGLVVAITPNFKAQQIYYNMPKAKAKATPKAKKANTGEKSRPQMLQAAEPDAFNVRFAFGLALARTDDPGFPVFLQPHQ